jgi:hypothetical protein
MTELDLVGQDMCQVILLDELDVTVAKLEIRTDTVDDQAVFYCHHFRFKAQKEDVGADFQQFDSVSQFFLDLEDFLGLRDFGNAVFILNLNKLKPEHFFLPFF